MKILDEFLFQKALQSFIKGMSVNVNSTSRQAGIKFGGIYANLNIDNMAPYEAALRLTPTEHKLRPSATRIFRELPNILATAKLIGKEPVDVHILGCSDGSEAYAHAIAIKESVVSSAAHIVNIVGIDYTPQLAELAQTGYLVCTDQEKKWANDSKRCPNHPLTGPGWEKYLEKTTEPKEFPNIVKKNSDLAQVTRDTVANISICRGMDWYKVRTQGLPTITFKEANMCDYVKQSPKNRRKQIYVVANSLAYVAIKKDLQSFVKVFQDIQNQNAGNETYVVMGPVEHQIFAQRPEAVTAIKMLGYEPVSKTELKSLGVQNIDDVFPNIWKSTIPIPVELRFI